MENRSLTPTELSSTIDRHERWRLIKDAITRHMVAIGGSGTIVAIVLIFFYLLYVVYPLFIPASVKEQAHFAAPGGGQTIHLATEELAEYAVRYTGDGRALFFKTGDGGVIDSANLTGGVPVTAVASLGGAESAVVLGLADGRLVIAKHDFAVSYPDDKRTVTPAIEHPYGDAPLVVAESGEALVRVAARESEGSLTVAATDASGRLHIVALKQGGGSLLEEEEGGLERSEGVIEKPEVEPRFLRINGDQNRLYVASPAGELLNYDISDITHPELVERVRLVEGSETLTSLEFLLGSYSLMAGTSSGHIHQWFPVRDENNDVALRKIRSFESQYSPIESIVPEQRRKGFVASDRAGHVVFYHATAHRTVLDQAIGSGPVSQVALSPRADALLAQEADGTLHLFAVHNEHPEVSWSALWGKVHYEGYDKPDYVWQSSASTTDFEPKFSLMPLAFGTLKAAFYAMLIAVPLAILGAIYTAYFMSGRMRQIVKPTIEIMEALPTVILGFLAGLWLAPFMESHLPGVFTLLVMLPVATLAVAYLWWRVPTHIRARVPDGWEAALLVPVMLLLGWGLLSLSVPMEQAFFGGDMRSWLTNEMGVGFDQRNALVVGIAMGLAVIPPIFSIAEDAIFSVPKHLTNGSLALGATPWQTLSRVVILTASPGIFSAVMIGLGRAVGETMIVLMATGNTPVMDFSIFQGMRTLSANVAVEMPESELNSTHWRVLFLSALVLFLFTFVVNTVAELVRQRLRRKYSSL